MTVQTFRELLIKRPFQPFRLIMSSGESYEVRHPEMAFLSKTDMYVGIKPDKDNIPADFRICSLLHVTAVEPIALGRGGAKRGELIHLIKSGHHSSRKKPGRSQC